MWVQKLLDFTGWESLEIQEDWDRVEEELQCALPDDYKELYRVFGGGVFGDAVFFYGRDENAVFDLMTQWRVALSTDRAYAEDGVFMMEPYSVYAPGGEGLLQWGATEWGDQYFWLLDAKNPGVYPVLARAEGSDEWKRYDVSTAEFLARVLSDAEFQPFGVSRYSLDPSFSYGSDPEA
ncbi:SMI1/KNR4 family protein [Streptomyces gardneri]|uniref:SMI1/KNR4 family protein n=1 Tax=Streptomyces gardneri TaxID=66892 RepID=UPI0035D6B993